jgi:hypothetical protein
MAPRSSPDLRRLHRPLCRARAPNIGAPCSQSGLKEEAVSCRNYGKVSAKSQYQNGIVRVIDIQGLSHRISPFERAALNAALTDFGYLGRVSIGCNLRDDALITVATRPTIEGVRRMVRRLSIVWTKHAMIGTGGRPRPVQENGEDLYG